MKRVLSLLIAMVFCIAVFSACQSVSARGPGNQPDVKSVSAVFTTTEIPVRQVFTVRQNDGIKLNAVNTDVQTDAGIRQLNNSAFVVKFIKPEPYNDSIERLPPDRFNGFGADCAARAKI